MSQALSGEDGHPGGRVQAPQEVRNLLGAWVVLYPRTEILSDGQPIGRQGCETRGRRALTAQEGQPSRLLAIRGQWESFGVTDGMRFESHQVGRSVPNCELFDGR